MIDITKNRLVVPEAREAFEQYKMEIAKEFDVDDPRHLASKHTGLIVRDLVVDGQKQLIKEKGYKPQA